MRDGIFIVDGDGHVMAFPHRRYQKYLPEQYRRRDAFFPGAYWDRRQTPNGDMGRDPNTPEEMLADLGQEGIKRVSEPPARHGLRGFRPAGRCRLTTSTDSGRIAARCQGRCPRRTIGGRNRRGLRKGLMAPTIRRPETRTCSSTTSALARYGLTPNALRVNAPFVRP